MVPELSSSRLRDEPSPTPSRLLYRSPVHDGAGRSVCRVFGPPGKEVLRFPDIALFEVDDARIVYHLEPDASRLEAELMAAGPVLAFWHERAGRPVLHGACLAPAATGAPAFALLGVKEAGKSTLAGALLAAGAALLGDDLVPLDLSDPRDGRPRAHPIAPRLRLWPKTLDHLLGPSAADRFEPVHPSTTKRWVPVGGDPASGEAGLGTFDDHARPLGAIYLPERRRDVDRTTFEPLTPGQAVIELVRHSFLARMVEALGWQPRRLELLARVAEEVPVRRMVYPDGWEHLDGAVGALLDDLTGI